MRTYISNFMKPYYWDPHVVWNNSGRCGPNCEDPFWQKWKCQNIITIWPIVSSILSLKKMVLKEQTQSSSRMYEGFEKISSVTYIWFLEKLKWVKTYLLSVRFGYLLSYVPWLIEIQFLRKRTTNPSLDAMKLCKIPNKFHKQKLRNWKRSLNSILTNKRPGEN